MDINAVMALARSHLERQEFGTSARFCMQESIRAYDAGHFDAARLWAIKSLRYSVGIMHPDFVLANVPIRVS